MYIFICACCVLSCSVMADGRLFATLWAVVHQTPLSMGFSSQQYWSRLPFPPPGHLPDPGIEPASPWSPALTGRFFTTEQPGKPQVCPYLSTDTIWSGKIYIYIKVTSEINWRSGEGGGADFGEFNIQLSKCMCN